MEKEFTPAEKKRLAEIEADMKTWTPEQWKTWDQKQAILFKQREDDDADSLLAALKKVKKA